MCDRREQIPGEGSQSPTGRGCATVREQIHGEGFLSPTCRGCATILPDRAGVAMPMRLGSSIQTFWNGLIIRGSENALLLD